MKTAANCTCLTGVGRGMRVCNSHHVPCRCLSYVAWWTPPPPLLLLSVSLCRLSRNTWFARFTRREHRCTSTSALRVTRCEFRLETVTGEFLPNSRFKKYSSNVFYPNLVFYIFKFSNWFLQSRKSLPCRRGLAIISNFHSNQITVQQWVTSHYAFFVQLSSK